MVGICGYGRVCETGSSQYRGWEIGACLLVGELSSSLDEKIDNKNGLSGAERNKVRNLL